MQLGITRQSYEEIGYVWLSRVNTQNTNISSQRLNQMFKQSINFEWVKVRSGLLEGRKYVNRMYLFFLQEQQQQQHERRRIRAPLRMLLNVSRIPALSNKFLLARYTLERTKGSFVSTRFTESLYTALTIPYVERGCYTYGRV